MIGRVNTSDGAPYATINVECPASSSVTCALSNGSSAVTPVGGNGKYTFLIPSNGTWRLSGVYGSKTQTVDVVITQRGQCEFVNMEFPKYLYRYGDQYTSVTGGWKRRGKGSGTLAFNSDHIKLDGAYDYCAVQAANKINISGYTYLCVNVRNASMWSNTYDDCCIMMFLDEALSAGAITFSRLRDYSTANAIVNRQVSGEIPPISPKVYKIPLSHLSASKTYYMEVNAFYAGVEILEVYLI